MTSEAEKDSAMAEIARLERRARETVCPGCRSKLWDHINTLRRGAGLPMFDRIKL